jgi:hypothetical protein
MSVSSRISVVLPAGCALQRKRVTCHRAFSVATWCPLPSKCTRAPPGSGRTYPLLPAGRKMESGRSYASARQTVAPVRPYRRALPSPPTHSRLSPPIATSCSTPDSHHPAPKGLAERFTMIIRPSRDAGRVAGAPLSHSAVTTSEYAYTPVRYVAGSLASNERAMRRVCPAPHPFQRRLATSAPFTRRTARMLSGTAPAGPANCAATTGWGRACSLL